MSTNGMINPREPYVLAKKYKGIGNMLIIMAVLSFLTLALEIASPFIIYRNSAIKITIPMLIVTIGIVAVGVLYIIAGIKARNCGIDQEKVQACWILAWIIIATSFVVNLSYYLLIENSPAFVLLGGIICQLANLFHVFRIKKALAVRAVETNSYYDID